MKINNVTKDDEIYDYLPLIKEMVNNSWDLPVMTKKEAIKIIERRLNTADMF